MLGTHVAAPGWRWVGPNRVEAVLGLQALAALQPLGVAVAVAVAGLAVAVHLVCMFQEDTTQGVK